MSSKVKMRGTSEEELTHLKALKRSMTRKKEKAFPPASLASCLVVC